MAAPQQIEQIRLPSVCTCFPETWRHLSKSNKFVCLNETLISLIIAKQISAIRPVFRIGTRSEVINGNCCVQAGRRPAQGQRPCQGLRPFLPDENSTGHAI